MNQTHKDIMMDVFGIIDVNSSIGRLKLMSNFNEYETRLTELEEIYNDPDCKEYRDSILDCHLHVLKLYQSIIYGTINEFIETKYGQSLDFVLLNYSQEEIVTKLQDFLNKKGYPNNFKNDVYAGIKASAERLDKRFSFDEVALINLIEASCGKNIYTEQGGSTNVRNGDDKYIIRTEKGYEYKRTNDTKTLDNGSRVYIKNRRTSDNEVLLNPLGSERQESSKIQLEGFPLGNNLLSNTDNTMKKVMSNLFENLELCIETYNTIYGSGDNIVDNTAYLADGTTFDFSFIVNEVNIPHLLGIPRPRKGEVSQESINILNTVKHNGYPALSLNSSPLDLLKFLREHQNEIIDLGGLYEENGKKYEILNWEKMILKTTSFMRGDFFKTCFCLAQVAPNKSLQGSEYVSISSTEYNKGIGTSITARSVLNDLLNTVRKKRDFIFRGFGIDNGRSYIKTITTGKSEIIRVGSNNELIKTLQRYRDLFLTGSSGWGMTQNGNPTNNGGQYFDDSVRDKDELLGSIVEEIENEKFIRRFTPQEQAELGISISRDLSLVPHASLKALAVLQAVHNYNGAITSNELDEFAAARSNGNKHKKSH